MYMYIGVPIFLPQLSCTGVKERFELPSYVYTVNMCTLYIQYLSLTFESLCFVAMGIQSQLSLTH